MNILALIAKPFYEYVIEPLINYKSNFVALEQQKHELVVTKETRQCLADEALRRGETIFRDVEKWLSDADKTIKEAEKFLEENPADRNFFEDLCCNLVQRHRLSGEAKRITEQIHKIYEKRKFYHGVSYHGSCSMDWNLTVPSYVTFESREPIMQEIVEALKDPHMKMIGVHGMGGVGKTTLVDVISKRVMEERLFDDVVKVSISQIPDEKHIQGQLADQLGLELKQETEEGRAAFMRKQILEKKILIVLDDMWDGLKLEEIGIPSMDDCKGCKIVITSREYHVLSNEMNTNVNFEIKVLTEEESWKVFKNKVGEDVETNHELNEIARKVEKKCGCLPIALVVVATALKGKPLHTWRDVLHRLDNPTTSVNIKGVNKDLYVPLKLSYDILETEQKRLFLLCSMFPEDYEIQIDNLFSYAMGLSFLHGINTLQEARDRVFKLVDDLKSCCLLLKSERGNEYVKMHDVIRDVAIYITSNDNHIRTLSYRQGLIKWQDEDIEGDYTAIWVDYRSILDNPPRNLRFPKLELLALAGYGTVIPQILLEGTENLKVLCARDMNFFPWPPYFSPLVHLKTLSLVRCTLVNIDIISELKELEILRLSGSNIKELPKGMDQLVRLKLLDVSYCRNLEVIPPNVISRLKKLEELHTTGGFVGWEGEDLSCCEGKNMRLLELNKLSRLTTLNLNVLDVGILPKRAFLANLELESFEIVIGKRHAPYGASYNSSKVLDIKMGSKNILLDDGLKKLLKKSEKLILEASSHNGKDVLLELHRSDSPHLKYLRFENNLDIKYLMSEIDKFGCKMMFSILDHLQLEEMMGLESIIHGPVRGVEVFNNLKAIKVAKCPKLRNLFPLSIMKSLSNLEEMEILECEMMETIFIVESEEANNNMECGQLRRLLLEDLPQLMSICSTRTLTPTQLQVENDAHYLEIAEENQLRNSITLFNQQMPNIEEKEAEGGEGVAIKSEHLLSINKPNSLEDIYGILNYEKRLDVGVIGCPKLKRLQARHFQRQLCSLYTDDCGLDAILNNEGTSNNSKTEFPLAKDSFPNLTKLHLTSKVVREVWRCKFSREMFPRLKVLSLNDYEAIDFSLVPLPLLYSLEKLKVQNTKFLVEIFSDDGLTTIEKDQMRRPPALLKKLSLLQLPELMHIWKESSQLLFNNLECLTIEKCSSLKILVQPSFCFQNLRDLRICECHGLINLLHSSVAKTLVQLKTMTLSACKYMTTVLTEDENEEEKGEIVFSKLVTLELYDLPKLEKFQSTKCTLKFPSLSELYIDECLEMKTFSPGIVCTPLLKGVWRRWYSYDVGDFLPWAGNINDTLRSTFLEDDNTRELFMAENIMQNLSPMPSNEATKLE